MPEGGDGRRDSWSGRGTGSDPAEDQPHSVRLPDPGVLGGHEAPVELSRDSVQRLASAQELTHQANDLLLGAVPDEVGVLEVPAERHLALRGVAVPPAIGRVPELAQSRAVAHVEAGGDLAGREPGLLVHARETGRIGEQEAPGKREAVLDEGRGTVVGPLSAGGNQDGQQTAGRYGFSPGKGLRLLDPFLRYYLCLRLKA